MNKRLIILVLLAAFLLSAVSPWPTTLTVINQTGDNVYIRLKYRGEQKYFFTATPEGNSSSYHYSVFDVVRRVYTGNEVTACSTTTDYAWFDLRTNLRLRFTACDKMKQWWTPKYWGEPTLEKPNFYDAYTSKDERKADILDKYPFEFLYRYNFRFFYDVMP